MSKCNNAPLRFNEVPDRKPSLMKAARMGGMEAVKTLTSRSAHVNADGNNRETTLAFALREKHDVATVLRGSGAN